MLVTDFSYSLVLVYSYF